jgi:hypothetical protein
MSAQPLRNPNRSIPINQRSSSQTHAPLTIRVVPFTPPRIVSGERAPSQASSRAHAAEGSSGNHDDQATAGEKGPRTEKSGERRDGPGFALSSSSTWTPPLAGSRAEGVSGSKPALSDPRPPTTTPVHRESSEVTNATYITTINAPSPVSPYSARHHAEEIPSPSSSSTAVGIRPLSRKRNYVTLHPDNKTFSLVRQGPPSSIPSETPRSLISPPLSYSARTSVSSTHEGLSVGAWSEDQPSFGTDATILDRSVSPYTSARTPSPGSSTTQLVADPIASSPWNYRLVGGLRKVPKTPQHEPSSASETSTPTPLPPLPEISVSQVSATPTRSVVEKTSFASTETSSSVFETTNYELYGHESSPAQISSDSLAPPPPSSHSNYVVLGESSPVDSSDSLAPLPSSSHSNYVVLGESSPVAPSESSLVNPFDSSRPPTSDSDNNYVVHGDPSPSPAVALSRNPKPTYSQESLRVAPLHPRKKTSIEQLGYLKQRSRENLRARTGSLKSIKSFSSLISQEAVQAFFAAPVLLDIPNLSPPTSRGGSSRQQDTWAALPAATASSAGNASSSSQPHYRLQMLPSSHQWSSQLSTVMSESEGRSSRGASRSISGSSVGNGNNNSGGHVRRSSAGWASSMHSRQYPSISSSLAAQPEEAEIGSGGSVSRSGSVERPYPTYSRAGPSHIRLVRDQDEHGDGLTDLEQISSKPSKSGLSAFFSSADSSSRNLHSSGSSRANSLTSRANSITSSLPAWARVYYGSGERRFIGSPSIAESSGSRPSSSNIHGSASPNIDHFPMSLHTARKRANQVNPPLAQRPFSDSASMDINVIPQNENWGVFRTLKRKTSSVWSPHLRTDRRQSRYSVWEPPSVVWSADSGILGKRNAQVVLFMVGFIFPFGMYS